MAIFPSEDAIPTAPDAILADADPPEEELTSEQESVRADRERREEDLAP
jgi:hypothetical protein